MALLEAGHAAQAADLFVKATGSPELSIFGGARNRYLEALTRCFLTAGKQKEAGVRPRRRCQFAFRRVPAWRGEWLPTLLAVPAAIVAGVAFSFFGDGAATRATTTTWFVWLAFISVRLLRLDTALREPYVENPDAEVRRA